MNINHGGLAVNGGCGLEPLARGHHIPLRRQLAADLEAGIRDGRLRPGACLPSSRDLARLLGVDRGTVRAALARLRRRNLVEVRDGQRPRAANCPFPHWPETDHGRPVRRSSATTTRRMARTATLALLGRAHAGGLSRRDLLRELERIASAADEEADPRCVTLYEPRPGLKAILAAELQATGRVRVRETGVSSGGHPAGPVIVRRELLPRLRRRDALECLPLALAGGTRERDLVRRRLRRGLVVLLSGSETVRVFGAELAARDFARGVSFRAIDPDRHPRAARRAVAAAAIVFHDRLTEHHVRSPAVPAAPITLVPRRETERLERYLSTVDAKGARCGVGGGPSQRGDRGP